MRTEADMIAYVMEADPEILPLLPALLADFEALGGDADQISTAVAALNLLPDTRILDLGCGKGATAFAIAQRTPHHVLGIDLFAPFVEHAQSRAHTLELADRCTFMQADIGKLVGNLEPADALIFAALGDVLGPMVETVGILRQFVRPGGYLLIADDYIREGGSNEFPGYESYAGYDETRRRLQVHGDMIVQEYPQTMEEVMADNEEEIVLLCARAEQLAKRFPDKRDQLFAYVADQQRITAFMAANVVPVLWVLQRAC